MAHDCVQLIADCSPSLFVTIMFEVRAPSGCLIVLLSVGTCQAKQSKILRRPPSASFLGLLPGVRPPPRVPLGKHPSVVSKLLMCTKQTLELAQKLPRPDANPRSPTCWPSIYTRLPQLLLKIPHF